MTDVMPQSGLAPLQPPRGPAGVMPVRSLKVSVFHQATMAALMTVINNYCKGLVIAAAGAQPGYGANYSQEHTFVGLQLEASGTEFVAILTYAD